jgi:hypothetical protein
MFLYQDMQLYRLLSSSYKAIKNSRLPSPARKEFVAFCPPVLIIQESDSASSIIATKSLLLCEISKIDKPELKFKIACADFSKLLVVKCMVLRCSCVFHGVVYVQKN